MDDPDITKLSVLYIFEFNCILKSVTLMPLDAPLDVYIMM